MIKLLDLVKEISVVSNTIKLKAFSNPSEVIYLCFNGKGTSTLHPNYTLHIGHVNKNKTVVSFENSPYQVDDFIDELKNFKVKYEVINNYANTIRIKFSDLQIKQTSKYTLYDEDIKEWYNHIGLKEIRIQPTTKIPINKPIGNKFSLNTYLNNYNTIESLLNLFVNSNLQLQKLIGKPRDSLYTDVREFLNKRNPLTVEKVYDATFVYWVLDSYPNYIAYNMNVEHYVNSAFKSSMFDKNEIDRIVQKAKEGDLDEIKVVDHSKLNFPIEIDSEETFTKVLLLLQKENYKWGDASGDDNIITIPEIFKEQDYPFLIMQDEDIPKFFYFKAK